MSDRIEALVKEIAAKHGIAVGRDDPIMILQTINERLIQDSAAAQQDALDRFKEELESIAHRWGEDARAKAELGWAPRYPSLVDGLRSADTRLARTEYSA